MACRCGLVTAKREPVPLKSIAVELEVKDHVATVVSTLNYENKEDKPVEAVFVFPLPGDAAVCHFSATIGQTHIVAEVKEKQEAREDYDDALSSGQQAFLLEESEQSPDIFSLSVGSLPPGESASIRLEYVTELAVEADEGLRFCLPAVLNPRYTPRDSEAPSVAVTSVPASLIPYSLSFSGRLSSPRPISKVESTSSLEPLQYLNTEQTQATLKLAEGHKFDRDVELLIYYKDAHQPTAVVEAGQSSAEPGSLMGDPVVMVSLYPEFPQSVMSSMASCGEFVFLMDRSGSMQGSRIGSARDTLLLLLKSLPMGCYFNIYSFGSQFEYMFPKSVEYNQKTMEEALQKVGVMQANLGGTEILRPLEHIYSQPCIPGQPRQVFVFTDGEVWNTKEVTGLVKKNSGSHRCFSFGIGEGASSALINGLATEGNGRAQFITGSDRMQPKVMQSLRFALQPAVVDISVTWDLPKEVSIEVLSPPITTLFQGQRSLIYGRLRGQCAEEAESRVTVKYSLAGHPTENQLSFSLKPAADSGLTVHRLGARTLIRSLEAEERENRAGQDGGVKKKKATDLSIQSGVSSAFTSFIAVNKSNGKGIQGPLVKRHVSTPRMYMARTMSSPMAAPMADMKTSNQSRLPPPSPPPPAASNQSRLPPPPPPPAGCAGKKSSGGGISPEIMGMSKDLLSERRRRPNTCSNITLGPELFSYCSFDASPAVSDLIGAGEASRDPLLQLISLQNAAGYWDQDEALASALGKTNEEVEKSKPAAVPGDVWATILALIWLHGFKMDAKEEWELLAMKAVSWLRVQNAPGVTESIDAGNALLGCSLQKAALGI